MQSYYHVILLIAKLVFVFCPIISWYRKNAPTMFCLDYNWAVLYIILAFVSHVCFRFIFEFDEWKIVTALCLYWPKMQFQYHRLNDSIFSEFLWEMRQFRWFSCANSISGFCCEQALLPSMWGETFLQELRKSTEVHVNEFRVCTSLVHLSGSKSSKKNWCDVP